MFCKYCGTKLIDDAAFCHECGKTTCEQPAQPVPPAPPVQPVYQQSAQPAPAMQVVYQQPAQTTAAVQPTYQQPAPPVQPTFQQPVYQAPAAPVQPVYQPPVFQQPLPPQYTYTVPAPSAQPIPQPEATTPQLEKLGQQVLTCGILGLSLSMLGVPGIVFSSIAAKKASAYKKLTGKVDGKVLTGYRLAKAGRTVGIIMTVVLTLFVLTLQSEVTYEYNNPFEYYDF